MIISLTDQGMEFIVLSNNILWQMMLLIKHKSEIWLILNSFLHFLKFPVYINLVHGNSKFSLQKTISIRVQFTSQMLKWPHMLYVIAYNTIIFPTIKRTEKCNYFTSYFILNHRIVSSLIYSIRKTYRERGIIWLQ